MGSVSSCMLWRFGTLLVPKKKDNFPWCFRYRAKFLPVKRSSVRDALTLLHCYCPWGWNSAGWVPYAAVQWHKPWTGLSPQHISRTCNTWCCCRTVPVPIHQLCFPQEHHDPWGLLPTEPAGKSPRAEQVMRSAVQDFHSDSLWEDEISPSMGSSILFLCAPS